MAVEANHTIVIMGTPVNFVGMTGRALAVILKLNLGKSCDYNFFY
jgi:hypothetical protein